MAWPYDPPPSRPLRVRPERLARLPANLDEDAAIALELLAGHKSSARKDAFEDAYLGEYGVRNKHVALLIRLGYLTANRAGAITVTPSGAAMRERLPEEIVERSRTKSYLVSDARRNAAKAVGPKKITLRYGRLSR
jgi:hypothetical protein